MAPKKGGGLVVAYAEKGFGTINIDHKKGTITEKVFGIAPNLQGNNLVMNDAKCSPDGRFFAG
jgi:sugar lactone lactonase YvrE